MPDKTKAGWDESRQDLNKYLQIGDSVDDEMFDYFLGVLPPAYQSSSIIQIGEPYSHVNGWPTFSTLIRKGGVHCDGPWFYAGHCHRGHSQEPDTAWSCNGCNRDVSVAEVNAGKETCDCGGDFILVNTVRQ